MYRYQTTGNFSACICYERIYLVRTSTSADSLQHGFVRHFGEVGTLDVGGNTVQGSSQGVLGRGVNHLVSDGSGVWGPNEKDNFGSLPFAVTNFVLKIVDGVFTFVLWQLLQERVVVSVGGGFLDDDLSFGVVQSVNDILEFFAQLQVIEGS